MAADAALHRKDRAVDAAPPEKTTAVAPPTPVQDAVADAEVAPPQATVAQAGVGHEKSLQP